MCRVTLAAAVCCVLRTSAADAGAWTQDEGAWFLKIGYDRWVTSHRFDSAGTLVPYRDPAPPRFVDEFRSQALRVYAEYGLTSASTVIVSGGYEWLSSEGDGTVDRSSGLSDPRLQFRRRLVDRPFVVSVIGDVKLPIRTSKAIAPALGTGAIDYGGGFAVGGSLGTLYISTEAGYLVRGGRFADQVPFAAEAGWSIRHDMVVRAGARGTLALEGRLGAPVAFDPALSDPRDVTASVGVVLRGDPLDIAIDAERVLTGRNTLAGNRIGFSIWRASRPR